MGPPLLLDKSGIQSLPKKLAHYISRYYLFVVPPILVLEILGDLLKTRQGGIRWTRMLAEKLGATQFFINLDHRELRVANLLGKAITMDGRPVIESREFDTTLGKSSVIVDTKEHSQLLRWRFEQPSTSDQQLAKEWKQVMASINLEKTKAGLKLSNPEMPRVKTFAELACMVDLMLEFCDQRMILEMCLEDAHFEETSRRQVLERWGTLKEPTLRSFAPYAFFCFRIRVLFHVALMSDLVSTRQSNTTDLIYLYYAPFCNVFSSNDRLHEDFAPLVLRPDQYFIQTNSLRRDLETIEFFRAHLSVEQKRMWINRFGDWPPRNVGSFTYRIWRRKMVLQNGLRHGNILKNMSPDAREKLDEHLHRVMQQFKEIQEQMKRSYSQQSRETQE